MLQGSQRSYSSERVRACSRESQADLYSAHWGAVLTRKTATCEEQRLHSHWPHPSVPLPVFLHSPPRIPPFIDGHSLSAALKNVPALLQVCTSANTYRLFIFPHWTEAVGKKKKEKKKNTSEFGDMSSILFGINADCNWQTPSWW